MESKKGRHGEVVSEIRKLLKNREAVPFGLVLEYNSLLIGKKRFNEILSSSPILQKEHNAYEENFKRILPHATHEWYSGNMKTNENGEKVIPDSGYQPIIDGVIEGLRGILEKKESNKKLEEAKEFIDSIFYNDITERVFLKTMLDYLNEPIDTADNSIGKVLSFDKLQNIRGVKRTGVSTVELFGFEFSWEYKGYWRVTKTNKINNDFITRIRYESEFEHFLEKTGINDIIRT